MLSKTCSVCFKEKPLADFGKHKQRDDGLRTDCRKCVSIYNKKRDQTKKGKARKMANQQIHSSKLKGRDLPSYTRTELVEWLYAKPEYHVLYDAWKLSGFEKDLAPSVDRIDSTLPYTMSNIRLITWGQNKRFAYKDRKDGRDKVAKAVVQLELDGTFVAEFPSTAEAGRALGCSQTLISRACSNNNKSDHVYTGVGFVWKFKENT